MLSSSYSYTLGSSILYIPDIYGISPYTSSRGNCGIIIITSSCLSCIGDTLPSSITYNSAISRFEVISTIETDSNSYTVAFSASNSYGAINSISTIINIIDECNLATVTASSTTGYNYNYLIKDA